MQNPAACHTIREFSRVRFFCVSCIKYNDNCYLPFQESSKSDWIVSHSPKSIASEPLAWKAWDHHIHVKTNTWKRSSTIVTANINIKIESRWRSQSEMLIYLCNIFNSNTIRKIKTECPAPLYRGSLAGVYYLLEVWSDKMWSRWQVQSIRRPVGQCGGWACDIYLQNSSKPRRGLIV